ncbi:DUF4097 and DUF4098 domain-containing protein YvlB [Paenibacillus sp. 1_12]|uniref:DUF4097 family beta strand repeat-containing protein n=1 Tax=Paenibacillus sp. 1_12 TaxID=1566278 RepID=UPI0008E199F5|nr:DUF4097 family beta strand repeat-containing protein [Paenibacillus sp. 1_12]SFL69597.1 DUF4097 and DUF4098 domain-containing protein YvlB [Paenibacillus sp. 1_12]
MRKAGRYTAALLLMAVGSAVIIDKYVGSSLTALLVDWWPILFISLGLEYILLNMRYGESDKQLRLDLRGVVFAVLISAVVIGSTNTSVLFHNWFSNLDFGKSFVSSTMGGEGRKFQKEAVLIPIQPGLDRISISNNSSGSITIQSGSGSQLQIEATVYVALDNEKEAAEVANQTKIKQSFSGQTLKLNTEGGEYGGEFWSRKRPAMDLIITVPAQLQANMDIELTNGRLKADQLALKKQFKVRNTNGEIQLTDIEADIDLESTNARVSTSTTKGRLKLQTTNGSIDVGNHEGDAQLESTNGKLSVTGVTGSIKAETTNGNIKIAEALRALNAETTNGTLEVTSHTVSGEWDLKTSHGTMKLALPSTGDYRVKGEAKSSDVQIALPLQVRKDNIEGMIGSGKNLIKLKTKGSLTIREAN